MMRCTGSRVKALRPIFQPGNLQLKGASLILSIHLNHFCMQAFGFRHFGLLCAGLLSCLLVPAQKTDARLEKALTEMVAGFKGEIGFYIKNLHNGKVASLHADTVFPTASIVKVPILVGVMDKLEKGELNYHQKLIYKDSLLYKGEDILGSFKSDETIELSKVLMLMLTTSDNTASLWLQSLAGTGARINELMDGLALPNTRVNSRTPGREASREKYGWGQSTPAEMGRLFEMLVNRQVLNGHASDKMIKLLGRNYWDEEALSTIPAGVFVASKTGAVDASRNEVMYVNAAKTPYIFCIFTKNNADTSWKPENEAWMLTRKMSAYVWNYFNGN
jgi:beta-lactamase class A